MSSRRRYIKRPGQEVAAVQLALDTEGFTYRKWGGVQTCKAGDWIVNNGGDTYTVDRETFARTYRQTGPGTYVKSTPVWAEIATQPGAIQTREGLTHYQPGDYLVFNQEDGGDPYAVAAGRFEAMYVPCE